MKKELDKNSFKQVPLIYLYLYKRIDERFRVGDIISYSELTTIIKRLLHQFPSRYINVIIKELEEYNLIKRIVSGRSPEFTIEKKDYEDLIRDLDEIKGSTQRYKILKSDYDNLIKRLKEKEEYNQKYEKLKCNYLKFLRKLEEYHYW